MLRRRHRFGLTVLSMTWVSTEAYSIMSYQSTSDAVAQPEIPVDIITVVNAARDSITLRFKFGTSNDGSTQYNTHLMIYVCCCPLGGYT